jgi:cell division protein FtsZ
MESMAAQTENFALIRVVGVGGAGSNAVNRMIRAELLGVEFIAVNTDAQALVKSHAPTRIRIGDGISRGLGAGGDSAVGERAAQETIGIVTKPFVFEGKRRAAVAEAAANELRKHVDTLIVIPNERLLSVVSRQTSMEDSFRIADDVLRQAVKGVSDVITVPGIINLDFADVRSIMRDAGSALMGIGRASGENRATAAAEIAIASPLLEVDIQGATGVLINVAASATVTLHEVNEAINHITARADDEANIIFGTSLDESLGDEIQITVIATGFSAERQGSASSPRAPYRATDSGAWSLRGDGVAVQDAPVSSPTYTPAPAAEPTLVAIEDAADEPAPVGAPKPEEVESGDLEIPAFLRRQNF